jgi:hypothetical protein
MADKENEAMTAVERAQSSAFKSGNERAGRCFACRRNCSICASRRAATG